MAQAFQLQQMQTFHPILIKLSKPKAHELEAVFAQFGIEFTYDYSLKEEFFYPIDIHKAPKSYDFETIHHILASTGLKDHIIDQLLAHAIQSMYAHTIYMEIEDIEPLHIYTDIMQEIITQGGFDGLTLEQLDNLKRMIMVDTVLERFPESIRPIAIEFLSSQAEQLIKVYYDKYRIVHPLEAIGIKIKKDLESINQWRLEHSN